MLSNLSQVECDFIFLEDNVKLISVYIYIYIYKTHDVMEDCYFYIYITPDVIEDCYFYKAVPVSRLTAQ